ncbi:MAG: RNA polymerase sigma factor [Candidatus Cyclobacteriaceae bacterium M3_2C_046]
MNQKKPDLSDRETVLLLKNGETGAFNKIYDKYKAPVFSYCIHLVKSSQLAEELTHDVFLKIWQKKHQLNPDLSLKAFIGTICHHQVVSFLRKTARDDKAFEKIRSCISSDCYSLEDQLLFEEYKSWLFKGIEALPPKRQLIYRLCKLDLKSYDEVAAEYNISRNAVKDHMVKANHFLKDYLVKNADMVLLYIVIFSPFE